MAAEWDMGIVAVDNGTKHLLASAMGEAQAKRPIVLEFAFDQPDVTRRSGDRHGAVEDRFIILPLLNGPNTNQMGCVAILPKVPKCNGSAMFT